MVACIPKWCRGGALWIALLPALAVGETAWREVGVAKVDITPDYPVRLSGYAARTTNSQGVAQHLYAKALAFGGARERPAVLITVENCGLPGAVWEEVAARLRKKAGLDPARLAICCTHTHSAPWVNGYLPNLFGGPLPPEQQASVERYTREFTDALEAVAMSALADRRPAQLSRGASTVEFAANRRTKGGPVDHALPVLVVKDMDGNVRALLASYACHCTTLGGDFNQVCGDWAGFASAELEREYPGVIALVAVGCGGDSNPDPRSTLELARQHGKAVAVGVDQVLAGLLSPVEGRLVCRTRRVELPFDKLPTRAEWQTLAASNNIYVASHARLNLTRLDRGEQLPRTLPYTVQTWSFGDDLAMVFLPGEVVVDYSLRLKREFDNSRLWVNAYANEVPCYIPSERVLKEGGYEGGYAMIYYDRPARFASGLEDRIIGAVHKLLPDEWRAAQNKTNLNSKDH